MFYQRVENLLDMKAGVWHEQKPEEISPPITVYHRLQHHHHHHHQQQQQHIYLLKSGCPMSDRFT